MATKTESADFHIHYYPDLALDCLKNNQEMLDVHTEKTINKIIDSHVTKVALIGRIVCGTPELIESIKQRLEAASIESVFGMEYHSLLPPHLRHLSPSGLVDLVCLNFDHSNQEIQQLYGPESSVTNAAIAKKQYAKLIELGFHIKPENADQNKTFANLLSGKIPNKADGWSKLLIDLKHQNLEIFTSLENQFGGVTDDDRRPNGFTPEKNWLYRILFRPGHGLVFFYSQTPTEQLITQIHQAGGIVLYSPEDHFHPQIMQFLLENKIDGVMGWHGGKLTDLPITWIKKLRRQAKLILGGSDFDPVKDHWQPGTGYGPMFISPRRFQEFKKYIENHP